MKHFKKLTYTERLQIEALLKAKCSVKHIAEQLNKSRNTIYAELKRGSREFLKSDLTVETRYAADAAQRDVEKKYSRMGRPLKIGRDMEYADFLERQVLDGRKSPEAVLGEIRDKNLAFNTTICTATFYSYIDRGIFRDLTNNDLPQRGKRKKTKKYRRIRKAARPPRGESIEHRPEEVDGRETFGHWEFDTVVGGNRKNGDKKVLLVGTERKTRQEIIEPLKDKTARSVISAFDRIERRYGKNFRSVFKTITVDNGSEFSDFKGLQQSALTDGDRTRVYYCHPYSFFERGLNENQNRFIRRFYPKGSSFGKVTRAKIKQLETWINDYPRRSLNFKCSNDLFRAELVKLAGT